MESEVTEYFENTYGRVRDTNLKKFADGTTSRGFGFVTFLDRLQAEQAVQQHWHDILGHCVEAKSAGNRRHTAGYSHAGAGQQANEYAIGNPAHSYPPAPEHMPPPSYNQPYGGYQQGYEQTGGYEQASGYEQYQPGYDQSSAYEQGGGCKQTGQHQSTYYDPNYDHQPSNYQRLQPSYVDRQPEYGDRPPVYGNQPGYEQHSQPNYGDIPSAYGDQQTKHERQLYADQTSQMDKEPPNENGLQFRSNKASATLIGEPPRNTDNSHTNPLTNQLTADEVPPVHDGGRCGASGECDSSGDSTGGIDGIDSIEGMDGKATDTNNISLTAAMKRPSWLQKMVEESERRRQRIDKVSASRSINSSASSAMHASEKSQGYQGAEVHTQVNGDEVSEDREALEVVLNGVDENGLRDGLLNRFDHGELKLACLHASTMLTRGVPFDARAANTAVKAFAKRNMW